jgi:hypothetical protein
VARSGPSRRYQQGARGIWGTAGGTGQPGAIRGTIAGVLDHDDERRLAEIEDRLRTDDPEWSSLFEVPIDAPDHPARLGPLGSHPGWDEPPHPVVGSVLALVIAVLLTTLVTLVLGPNVGGLVGVVSLCVAGMYSYQVLRGCPGVRRRRKSDGADAGDDGADG